MRNSVAETEYPVDLTNVCCRKMRKVSLKRVHRHAVVARMLLQTGQHFAGDVDANNFNSKVSQKEAVHAGSGSRVQCSANGVTFHETREERAFMTDPFFHVGHG